MSPSRNDERIKWLKEAVRLVEKSGQSDTVFHQELAALEGPVQSEELPEWRDGAAKDAKPAEKKGGKE